MVRRDYSGMTIIAPDSPNYNRGVLYGVLSNGIEEIPSKDIKLEDLADVNIAKDESGNIENKDILMYNEETKKWENKNMDKYLEDNLVDGGGVPFV